MSNVHLQWLEMMFACVLLHIQRGNFLSGSTFHFRNFVEVKQKYNTVKLNWLLQQ